MNPMEAAGDQKASSTFALQCRIDTSAILITFRFEQASLIFSIRIAMNDICTQSGNYHHADADLETARRPLPRGSHHLVLIVIDV